VHVTSRRVHPAVLVLAACFAAALLAFPFRHALKGNVRAAYDLTRYRQSPRPHSPPLPRLVAHAGGAVHGISYTNSREALDQHYAGGYRIFELDFNWTSDNRLVIVHDWSATSRDFHAPNHVYTYQDFIESKRPDGLHQLTFDDLHRWLRAHPEALIVTDTKASNPRLLEYLQNNAPDILPQLVVQIYRVSELQIARSLHPRAVWLTIYKSAYPAWALARISGADAFVIPVEWYSHYTRPGLMQSTPFYVHSVAASQVDSTFRSLPGIYGIYVN